MRWILGLCLIGLIFVVVEADHYQTLGVSRTASQSQIRAAFQSLSKQWHPDKNTEAGASEKYKDIVHAYDVLSDPTKRNEYELSMRPGQWVSTHNRPSPSDTVELTASNWDWNMRMGNRGQTWIVLFCGESYKGCSQAFSEWEKAFQLIGPYCRMGRVNVDAQWSIVSNFGIRYVPSLYTVVDEELRFLQTPITVDALYSFARNSLPSVFKDIRSISDWNQAFDWEGRLKRQGFDSPELVQVVLFSDDKHIPLKWRYWARQYHDGIVNWYFIHPSFASKSLISHLSSSYGVSHPGVAMLFPNPRDNTNVVILADPDTNGQSTELTSPEIEEWLKIHSVPVLAKLDASNFLQVVGNTHYTLVMAVDMSVGSSSGQIFGNSRVKRFAKMIDPMTTLWEQRRGTSLRDLQFTWFGTHKTAVAKAFGLTKYPPDGQLFLVDRRRWEYSLLPLDIDRDDISAFVHIIVKHSQRQLPMKKMLHIPQPSDEQWSLSESLEAASSFGYPIIGIGILILMTTWVVMKSPSPSKKPSTSQQKPNGTKSAPSFSSSQSFNTDEKASGRQGNPEAPKPSSSEKSDFSGAIKSETWREIRASNYETMLRKRNFTVILFPRLDRPREVETWQKEVDVACDLLSTDSVSLTWVHSHNQRPYVEFWTRHCSDYLASEDEGSGPGRIFGILIRPKGSKFTIFSGSPKDNTFKTDQLVTWVLVALEGQATWMDIPADSPALS